MTRTVAALWLLLAAPKPAQPPSPPECTFQKRWVPDEPTAAILDLTHARTGGEPVLVSQKVKQGVCVHVVQLLYPGVASAGFFTGPAEFCPHLPTLFRYRFDPVECTLTLTADTMSWVYR